MGVVVKITKDTETNAAGLACLWGISQQRISQLASEEKIPRRGRGRFGLIEANRAYYAPKIEGANDGISLEEARTSLAIEDAALKRIQREKLEGKLADVDEVIQRVTDLANDIEAIIRTSPLEEDRKGDIYSAIRQAAKDWGDK